MADRPAWEKIGVAAALSKSYAEDQSRFLERLARWLSEMMPGETRVKRRGLFSNKGIERITLSAGEHAYGIESQGNGPILFTRARVVKGISLKTDEIEPEQWLAELGELLEKRAGGSLAAREALRKIID